ncbi:pyridoxamine 5'-phosphate oxidase family protein [Lentzea sp. NPDC058436]|uniref:pyridoxamine 5'-phosphate oxidase family protein n=1 Tax=Lentzea sp. NPDC058436 TaxID=3346499 RepID=UPI00364BA80C
MSLTVAEREEFLAQPHIAAISVVAGSGRGPLTVPIWYSYRPGGDVLVITGAQSRKAGLIAEAGRFSLMVETMTPQQVCYVSVEGPVVRTEAGTDAMVRTMATRYMPPDRLEAYLAMAKALHGEQVAISMRPEHWLSRNLVPV